MEPIDPFAITRRHFLTNATLGLGSLGLLQLLGDTPAAAGQASQNLAQKSVGGLPGLPHFPPKV